MRLVKHLQYLLSIVSSSIMIFFNSINFSPRLRKVFNITDGFQDCEICNFYVLEAFLFFNFKSIVIVIFSFFPLISKIVNFLTLHLNRYKRILWSLYYIIINLHINSNVIIVNSKTHSFGTKLEQIYLPKFPNFSNFIWRCYAFFS